MTETIKVLKQQPNLTQVLVSHKGNYYVVSYSTRLSEPETYIFNSDSQGNITDWAEVGGTKGGNVRQVIDNMDEYLYSADQLKFMDL